jgi:hypothetical protein
VDIAHVIREEFKMLKSNLRKLSLVIVTTLMPSSAMADVITEWSEIAVADAIAARQLPPEQSRSLALLHAAMFDAVNSVERRYRPFRTKAKVVPEASKEAAASAAAHTILVKLYPDAKEATDKSYAAALAPLSESESTAGGVKLGEAIAAELLASRAANASGAPNTYRPVTTKGVYVPTALPVSMDAATAAPWFIESPAQFRPEPPPALASKKWAEDYNEVKEFGGKNSPKRTAKQTEIAKFWATTGVATWNPIIKQLSAAKKLDLVDNARLFALVHLAAADAYTAVFDAKYHYNFWRPITAIRNGDIDDNDATDGDAGWQPLIDTPMHPEYPCAHCITSSAVGAVLEAYFGSNRGSTITMTSPTAPGATHTWDRIGDYVEEVSNARVWGGVHYRTSAEVAREMGRKIGNLAITTLMLPLDK